MRVYGIDFTSRPTARKPLVCVACRLRGAWLEVTGVTRWQRFDEYEAMLSAPGPWISGIDFPFSQSRRFIQQSGSPSDWASYVEQIAQLSRQAFRDSLDDYRTQQPTGHKEHRRECDIAAGALSPQKLYGTPVALMFYEGAPRLRQAGVTIPYLNAGDPQRVVVETYPALIARKLIGRRSYKQDSKAMQSTAQQELRRQMLRRLVEGELAELYSIRVSADASLADDPSADTLDALFCAIQAAWTWRHFDAFTALPEVDCVEGWIADPQML